MKIISMVYFDILVTIHVQMQFPTDFFRLQGDVIMTLMANLHTGGQSRIRHLNLLHRCSFVMLNWAKQLSGHSV